MWKYDLVLYTLCPVLLLSCSLQFFIFTVQVWTTHPFRSTINAALLADHPNTADSMPRTRTKTHHCPCASKGNCVLAKKPVGRGRYCSKHQAICPNCSDKHQFIRDSDVCPGGCGYFHPDNKKAAAAKAVTDKSNKAEAEKVKQEANKAARAVAEEKKYRDAKRKA